jgi:hypothetical protein
MEDTMTHRFACCLVIASLALAPRRSAADPGIQVIYDTVDAVEIKNHDFGGNIHALVVVRGIRAGGSVPVTSSFDFGTNKDMATRCERLAVIAMSKPGKYQFGIGSDAISSNPDGGHGDCELILVTN